MMTHCHLYLCISRYAYIAQALRSKHAILPQVTVLLLIMRPQQLQTCIEHTASSYLIPTDLLPETFKHFTFWISLILRPKTLVCLELRLTNHYSAHRCSLHNVIADISICLCLLINKRKSELFFVHQNLISN